MIPCPVAKRSSHPSRWHNPDKEKPSQAYRAREGNSKPNQREERLATMNSTSVTQELHRLATLGQAQAGLICNEDKANAIQRIKGVIPREYQSMSDVGIIMRLNKVSFREAQRRLNKLEGQSYLPFARYLSNALNSYPNPRPFMAVAKEFWKDASCTQEQLHWFGEWSSRAVMRYLDSGYQQTGILALLGVGGAGKNARLSLLFPEDSTMQETGLSWTSNPFRRLAAANTAFINMDELGSGDTQTWNSLKAISTQCKVTAQAKGEQAVQDIPMKASLTLTSNNLDWMPQDGLDDGSCRRIIPFVFYNKLGDSTEVKAKLREMRPLALEVWSAVINELPYWLSQDTSSIRDTASILEQFKNNPYAAESSSDKVMDWLSAQNADFIPASLVVDAFPEMRPSQLKAVILQSGLWTHTRKRLEPSSNPVSVFKRQQEVF